MYVIPQDNEIYINVQKYLEEAKASCRPNVHVAIYSDRDVPKSKSIQEDVVENNKRKNSFSANDDKTSSASFASPRDLKRLKSVGYVFIFSSVL